MDREGMNILEALIDRYGLQGVVSGLSYVCSEKGQHIAAHWQDQRLSKRWMGYAEKLDRVTAVIESGTNGGGLRQTA
jgi:hypothetical protein